VAEPDTTQRSLVVEANDRFWNATNYKRGQRLKQSDPADRRMMPVWMNFYRQVLRERTGAAGTAQPSPAPTSQVPPQVLSRPDRPWQKPIEPESSGPGAPLTALVVAGGVVTAGLLGLLAFRSAGQSGRSRSRSRSR